VTAVKVWQKNPCNELSGHFLRFITRFKAVFRKSRFIAVLPFSTGKSNGPALIGFYQSIWRGPSGITK
jgi:hypothetical protein